MKFQLSNTIYGLKFAMEENDFEQLKSCRGKKRNDFVANPIYNHLCEHRIFKLTRKIVKDCGTKWSISVSEILTHTGKKNMVKSTGRSPVANFTLA